jgi:Ca2+-binding RTX toxin-like protein
MLSGYFSEDSAMSLTTGINSIDSLVYSSWASTPGQAVTLTYSFLTRVPNGASTDDANGFAQMNAMQKDGARAALLSWASVANISFQEVSANGNIQLGTNNQGSSSSAYAYLPDGQDPTSLYLNNQGSYNWEFSSGSFGASVLIHELGHTLGLKHPGNYNSTGGDVDGPFLPSAVDNIDYSQMSYHLGAGFKLNGNYGVTPMLYDIQAIQYLYGANMSFHTGADTYSFAKDAALQCIWDAGGTDTLDFSACTDATVINLNAGSFSATAPGYNNISIAYNVTIERAIAGSGGSTIYGNAAGNVIAGGAGNDVIYQGAGSDQISGNGGSDTVVFGKALAAYALSGSIAALTVGGEGTDTLAGISRLQFSDTTIQLSSYSALVTGSAGNDVFSADAGNQLISGGAGRDTLTLGGSVANYKLTASGSTVALNDLSGNGGNDLLISVERLQFADGALALDTTGAAGAIYRLFDIFNRAPAASGMGFWLNALDQGVKLVDVAAGFVNSAEFGRIYGVNTSNAGFVTSLFNNVLDRSPAAAGLNFWVAALDSGVSRADVVVNITESAEHVQTMSHIIPVGIAYTPYLG